MRRLGGQRGQTAVEYLGVLLVVGVMIATIAASGIAATVSDAIGRQICRVASDGPCEQSVASGTDGRSDGGERLPGPGRSAGAGAPSVDQGQAQVAGRARGRALTLRPAVARQGAQTCFATTSGGDCRPPGGAYELAPREPTPGEQIDGLLSDAGDSTEAWLGWLSGSDPSSPFYDPLAQDEREGQLEALDDGLAFLEDLNRAPSPLGSTGPLGDSGGDLGNELLGISDLRRAIDASQRGDSLQALGFFGLAWPFSKPGKAIQEGLEETTEQTGRQATREGTERAATRGGESAASAYGRKVHREFDYGPGFRRELTLPSGRRADAVNLRERVVVELKPNNPAAIRRGQRQLEIYKRELEDTYPGAPFRTRLETYDRP